MEIKSENGIIGNRWGKLSGGGTCISVGKNGQRWIIGNNEFEGTGRQVYRFVDNQWKGIFGSGVRIAVDSDGMPWVVNLHGEIYRLKPGDIWERLPGKARDIAISYNNEVYAVGTESMGKGYLLYRWAGIEWSNRDTNGVEIGGAGVRIALDNEGNPWIINNENEIFKRSPLGNWERLPDLGREISIGPNNSVWIIGTDNKVYTWQNFKWVQIDGSAHGSITVKPDGLPIVCSGGSLHIDAWFKEPQFDENAFLFERI